MNIIKIIENILRQRSWGLYDKQEPLQKLPLNGETPLFKVHDIEFKYLEKEIKQAMEEDRWKNSNSDGSQENTSQNG